MDKHAGSKKQKKLASKSYRLAVVEEDSYLEKSVSYTHLTLPTT